MIYICISSNYDFGNLIYHYKGPTANVGFNIFVNGATLFDKIKTKRIKLADAEKIKYNLN